MLPTAAQVTEGKGGWHCGAVKEWETAEVKPWPQLTLNNFRFTEGQFDTQNTPRLLKVQHSTINGWPETYQITGQFVGFNDADAPTFAATTAAPPKGMPKGVGTATGGVLISGAVLARTVRVCAAFVVE